MKNALEEYNQAIGIAASIAACDGDAEIGVDDVIDAHMKIGDIHKDFKQYPEALAEYQSGLAACEVALAKHPDEIRPIAQQGEGVFPHRRAVEGGKRRSTTPGPSTIRRRKFRTRWSRAMRRKRSPTPKSLDPELEIEPRRNLYAAGGCSRKRRENRTLRSRNFSEAPPSMRNSRKSEPGNPQWLDFITPNYYVHCSKFSTQSHRSPRGAGLIIRNSSTR